MTTPCQFDLAVGPAGLSRLTIHPTDCAGVDLTPHVRMVGLRWAEGEVPVLAIELHADADDTPADGGEGPWEALEGCEAITLVKMPTEPSDIDLAGLVAGWLSAIDPQQLERDALARAGWGDDSTGRLMLDTLAAYAAGQPGNPGPPQAGG